MRFVGVDLTSAFSAAPRPVDVAVLDDGLCCSFHRAVWPDAEAVIAREPEALWRMIAGCLSGSGEQQVWAIDGPQGLASSGASVRQCEIHLATPGRTPDSLPAIDSAVPFHAYIRSTSMPVC